MFKYMRAIFLRAIDIIYSYFTWMIPFSRHPNRYSIDHKYRKVQAIGRRITKNFHIDFVVKGHQEIGEGPYLFVCNHQSFVDPMMVTSTLDHPIIFVGKAEIKKMPFFGRILKGMGGVFIERGNLRQEIKVLQHVKKSLIDKQASWIIFPEGTRNRDHRHTLLPFKAGSFKIALDSKVAIIPIVVYGSFRPLNAKYHLRRYPVQVSYLPMINYDQYKDLKTIDLSDKIYKVMQEELTALYHNDKQLLNKKNKGK
jgi:1-acyl-sn-glycerol-3-phosphate acyltransferase